MAVECIKQHQCCIHQSRNLSASASFPWLSSQTPAPSQPPSSSFSAHALVFLHPWQVTDSYVTNKTCQKMDCTFIDAHCWQFKKYNWLIKCINSYSNGEVVCYSLSPVTSVTPQLWQNKWLKYQLQNWWKLSAQGAHHVTHFLGQ